ncbi:hypothetical protein A988_05820 [Pseudomonas syringae BRIP39023]|nr:hypothetical protein A988_05820 [Pseudomonas syringae BRIP39023]
MRAFCWALIWFSHPGVPDALHSQDRTQSVQNGMPMLEHGHDGGFADAYRALRSGTACLRWRRGAMVVLRAPIVPHAPRGNAGRDALRHLIAPDQVGQDRTSRSQNGVPMQSMGTREE